MPVEQLKQAMRWGSAVSVLPSLRENLEEISESVRHQLGEQEIDLAMLFVSPHFRDQSDLARDRTMEYLRPKTFMGCSAGGVIGGGQEIERVPAVSLVAASLPGVRLTPIYSDTHDLPDEDAPPTEWRDYLGLGAEEAADFVILADPFSVAAEGFLGGLDYAFPQCAKIGGLASGGQQARENVLFLDQQVHDRGLVAVALTGNVDVDTIVAQGCRPIGTPVAVTRCEQNLLREIEHQPPLQYLRRLVEGLSEYDRKLVRTSLFLGIQTSAFEAGTTNDHFLIRNLIGLDYPTGAIAVGALLREGQLVQFHLRDSVASDDELRRLLARYADSRSARTARGALLFSCLGRGEYLYGEPGHDSQVFRSLLGPLPVGGFFCNGEIGPVGSATYLHGYTSAIGIFRPAE